MKKVFVKNYLHDNPEKTEITLNKGVVIKIDSFVELGRDYHNYWGVILSYNNNEYKVAIQINNRATDIIYIKEDNIKWVIGTLEIDCVDIGAERHKNEVVKLINKYANY